MNNRLKMHNCYSNSWCHREQKGSNIDETMDSVTYFRIFIPFVRRFMKDNFGLEGLKLGNKVFYTLLVNLYYPAYQCKRKVSRM